MGKIKSIPRLTFLVLLSWKIFWGGITQYLVIKKEFDLFNLWFVGFLGVAAFALIFGILYKWPSFYSKTNFKGQLIAVGLASTIGGLFESVIWVGILYSFYNPYWLEIPLYDGLRLFIETIIFGVVFSVAGFLTSMVSNATVKWRKN